jgi:gamma-glutamylputrescine oxidase
MSTKNGFLLERYPVRASLWGQAEADPGTVLAGEQSCDVVVVGAGLAGLSTAYFLRQADPALRVRLLEAEYVGFGASGRNFCNVAQLAKTEIALFIQRLGREGARFLIDHQARMFEDFQSLLREEDIGCEFAVADLLHVARREQDAASLAEIYQLHREFGFPSELLDEAGARERVNLASFGGLSTARNGYAQPFLLCRGLRAAVLRNGVTLHEGTPMTGLSRRGGRVVVLTPRGHVSADTCVLATNAATPALGVGVNAITPTYTYAIATEPLDDESHERLGWSQQHRLINDFGDRYWYMQLRPNRQLLIGDATSRPVTGDGVSLPVHENTPAFRRIHAELVARFPWLEDARIDCAWGGPLDMTASRLPVTAEISGGVWLNAGYSARGVLMAALSGRVVAPALTGRRQPGDDGYRRFAELVLRAERPNISVPAGW